MIPTDLTILFVSVTIFFFVCALAKIIALKLGYIPSIYVLCFLIGLFVSSCIKLMETRWDIRLALQPFTITASRTLNELLCPPVVYFYYGYMLNIKVFKQSFIPILVLGVSANLIQLFLLYFIVDTINYFKDIPNLCLLYLCVICMPQRSVHSRKLLKKSTTPTRHIEQLLEGESFVSTLMSLLLYYYLNAFNSPTTTTSFTLGIISGIAKNLIGILIAIITGLLFGTFIRSDATALISHTLGALYLTFIFSFVFLSETVEIASIVLGIIVSQLKGPSDRKNDLLDNFWANIFYVIEILTFFISSVKVSHRKINTFHDIADATLIYFFTILLRSILWLISSPLMGYLFGYQMPRKILAICILAPYKTTPPLLMASSVITHGVILNHKIESIIAFIVCIHCLFNLILLPSLSRYAGITIFSDRRMNKINQMFEKIHYQKQKATEYIKKDFVTANSNWEIVDHLTTFSKPKNVPKNVDQQVDMNKKEIIKVNRLDITLSPKKIEFIKERDSKIHFYDKNEKEGDISSLDILVDNKGDIYLENKIRKQIFEMELISYKRQLQEEVISKETHLYLKNIGKKPMIRDTWKTKKIKQSSFIMYDYIKRTLISCYQGLTNKNIKQPANQLRSDLLQIITSSSYKLLLTIIIVVDSISQLLIVAFYYSNKKSDYTIWANYFQMIDYFCYGFFIGEFIFQIIGWGFIKYFEQKISLIEFSVSVVIRSLEQTILYSKMLFDKNPQEDILQESDIVILLKLMFILRLAIIKPYIIKNTFKQCHNILENSTRKCIMKNFEKKYGMAIAFDDLLPSYHEVFGRTFTDKEIKCEWVERRNINILNMWMLEEKYQGTAVAMKSKQVAFNVLKDIEIFMNELRQLGFVFDHESWIFSRYLTYLKSQLRNVTQVQLADPTSLLKEVYWLRGDYTCSTDLLNHASIVIFKKNEYIVDYGEQIDSLFLITSGVCRYIYKPKSESLYKLILKGILPNSDYYLHLRFEDVQKDVIPPGNLIGEFGLISGRPYNTRILCESNVCTIRIPYKNLVKYFYKCHFGGIRQAKLWKTIGIRFSIKHFSLFFKMLSRELFITQLHKSLVPILDEVKVIDINDKISDIILIEGTITDALTRCQLFAPLHITSNNQKFIINKDLDIYEVPARLMFVPKPGVTKLDLLNSNKIFKNYLNFKKLTPKFIGKDTCVKNLKRLTILRNFLKKHKKYMVLDFILQIKDPKIGIPCCFSQEKEKRKLKMKRYLRQRIPTKVNK